MSKAPLTRQSYPQDKQENNFCFCWYFSPVAVCYVAFTRALLINSNVTFSAL